MVYVKSLWAEMPRFFGYSFQVMVMRQFLAGMFFGAGLLFVAMHFHVVRGNEGVVLVPKISNTLSGTYADVRGYTLNDWKEHKPLAAAITQSNKSHLLQDSANRAFGDSMRGLVDDLFQNKQ